MKRPLDSIYNSNHLKVKFDHYKLLSPSKAFLAGQMEVHYIWGWQECPHLYLSSHQWLHLTVITPKTYCFFTYYFGKNGMLQCPSLGLLPQVYLLLKAGIQCWASAKGVQPSTLRNWRNKAWGRGKGRGVQPFPWASSEMGSNVPLTAYIFISGPWCSQSSQSWSNLEQMSTETLIFLFSKYTYLLI